MITIFSAITLVLSVVSVQLGEAIVHFFAAKNKDCGLILASSVHISMSLILITCFLTLPSTVKGNLMVAFSMFIVHLFTKSSSEVDLLKTALEIVTSFASILANLAWFFSCLPVQALQKILMYWGGIKAGGGGTNELRGLGEGGVALLAAVHCFHVFSHCFYWMFIHLLTERVLKGKCVCRLLVDIKCRILQALSLD